MGLGGKHLFGSIDDVRVTFVEKKVSDDRARFLKKLLEHNGFEVLIQEEKRTSEEEPQQAGHAQERAGHRPRAANRCAPHERRRLCHRLHRQVASRIRSG